MRIVPKDTIQGAALATLMKEDGCTKVCMTNDKEVYGAGLATNIQAAAEEQGLEIIANDPIDKNAPNYRSLASKAKDAGADCFIYSGITANNAVQLYKDFAAALPDAKLYGPDGVAEAGLRRSQGGRHPGGRRRQGEGLTVATLSPDEYPPDGQEFFDTLQAEVRRAEPEPVRDLRLRGDAAGARRDRALRDRREGGHPRRRCSRPRTARACSAPTRSTRTATPR